MVCWPPSGGQPAPSSTMHIVYADEAGTHAEAAYFVLAGLAVFERETFFLSQDLDAIAERYFSGEPDSVELHSSLLMAQQGRIKEPYDSLDFEQRMALRNEVIRLIADSRAHLFAVAIEKAAIDESPYERALEEIIRRFDLMLRRFYQAGDRQRGIVVVAESSYRENLQALAKRIWTEGHRWGDTRNMADVPFFAHAKSSRLLQLADFAANAVYRRYEVGDARQFDVLAQRFDSESRQLHGLVHIARDRRDCACPACVLWRAEGMRPSRWEG